MPLDSRRLSSQLNAASELWHQIKDSSYPADRFLGNYFHRFRKKFGSRDRRFLSEIIYSIFRNKRFFEAWAEDCKQKDDSFLVLLAAGMEGLISAEEFISFTGDISAKNLYPKLQARTLPSHFKTIPSEQALSVRYSFPQWLVHKWKSQFGLEEMERLLESCQNRPLFTIRVNTLKISRMDLSKKLEKNGFQVKETAKSKTGIVFQERANLFDSEEFREGLFEVQDEGSQLVCEKIDAKPEEIVWDVCAGGGGKSLAMAASMRNKGRIIATDIREKKLEELRKRAKRAGVTNIFPADLTRMKEIKSIQKGIDKIVVDAPCSGTGTLRRNPDAKWKLNESVFARNHKDQVQIIKDAIPYLKPGGILYYITCSLEPEENETVMEEVLTSCPEMKKIPASEDADGFFRLLPQRSGTDGFFLAILQKTNKISTL